MSKEYFKFRNKTYVFNVDAIMKWCLSSKDSPAKEYEITEGYDMEDPSNVGSKVVRELRSPNTQDDTIRYDFLKMLITPFFTEVGSYNEIQEDFSLSLSFNTLIKMGFIVEINE